MSEKNVISKVEDLDGAYGNAVFIPQNKVLYIDTFNQETPITEEDHELFSPHNISEVFEHYQPVVENVCMSSLEDDDYEDFTFRKISDFNDEELISQSKTLSKLRSTIDTYNDAIRVIEQNRELRRLLASNPEKKALLNILRSMKKELDSHIN